MATKFPRRWVGDLNNRHFVARPRISFTKSKRRCNKCDRPVRRSYRTGILHPNCFTCRYLMMVYGPSIEVTYVEE